MTEEADAPAADADAPAGESAAPAGESAAPAEETTTTYAWAPAEPTKKKRRGAIWASSIAVVTVAGVVAASLVLIAPGTAIAGVQVGGLTAGAAAEAVHTRLLQTQVVLTGDGGDATVTGAELGADVDAQALADAAFAQNPMWNPSAWFAGATEAEVTLDDVTATAALRNAAPALFTDPVDAIIAFDAEKKTYAVTPAVPGTGVDVDAVRDALHTAFADGLNTIDVKAVPVEIEALTPTFVAQAAADMLNGMISNAGFYIGKERTVPVSAETLASWLTLSTNERGAVVVTADEAAIQAVVDTLAEKVDRDAKPTTVIADGDGKVLTTLQEGRSGRTLGATAGLAAEFAAQLQSGNAVFALPVEVEESKVTKISRSIEVDLSEQRVYLRQDGKVVNSYLASTGKSGTPTFTGTYRIGGKLTMQNMGNKDLTKAPHYYTENVPWVMYFNGDQAFHGAYWHNNFGNVMSHGCINLPVGVAKTLFEWAPVGTVVWIHG